MLSLKGFHFPLSSWIEDKWRTKDKKQSNILGCEFSENGVPNNNNDDGKNNVNNDNNK